MAGPGRRKRADNPHLEGASRLAIRLRQFRERAKKTQEEVAATAGLSVATVRKIETGAVTEPGYFTVLAIASAVGVSIADLAELACYTSSRYIGPVTTVNSSDMAMVACTTSRYAPVGNAATQFGVLPLDHGGFLSGQAAASVLGDCAVGELPCGRPCPTND